MNINCGIIGYGCVGKELSEDVKREGWGIAWVAKRAGLFTGDLQPIGGPETLFKKRAHEKINIVFNALPSVGDGAFSHRVMLHFLHLGIPVVVCEKAALAHRFDTLFRHRTLLRFSAAVGGKSGIIPALLAEPHSIERIYGVVNTTLNFVWQSLFFGMSIEEALREASRNELVEPGGKTPEEILNAERRDLLLKSVILFNVVAKPKTSLSFAKLAQRELDLPLVTFERVMRDCNCLPAVSLERDGSPTYDESKCKLIFQDTFEGWRLRVSFDHPDLLPFSPPKGLLNTLWYETVSGDKQTISGIGAGASATAETMIQQDAKDVLRL